MTVTVILAIISGALAILAILGFGPGFLLAVAVLLLAICEVIRG